MRDSIPHSASRTPVLPHFNDARDPNVSCSKILIINRERRHELGNTAYLLLQRKGQLATKSLKTILSGHSQYPFHQSFIVILFTQFSLYIAGFFFLDVLGQCNIYKHTWLHKLRIRISVIGALFSSTYIFL